MARGKQWIHTSGSGETSFDALMNSDHDGFLESMADADQSVGVQGGENADVHHLRVRRGGAAVAVHAQAVGHVDIDGADPIRQAGQIAVHRVHQLLDALLVKFPQAVEFRKKIP